MLRKAYIPLFFTLSFALPLLIYATVNWVETRERLPVFGESGSGRRPSVESFNLRDQDGQVVTRADWTGKIVVINFFFTRCPVVCPKMMGQLARVQAAYTGDEAVKLYSFTVDPLADSLPRLKAYAAHFGINNGQWKLLTGDKPVIYRLARRSFFLTATDGDGGPLDFLHSDKLVLLDREGRIRGYYTGTDPQEAVQLIADIKKLKDEN